MAFDPFLWRIKEARDYYGPALKTNKNKEEKQYWTDEAYRPTYSPSYALGRTGKFALGLGAVAGAGFIPYKNGTVWDKYLTGIRSAEEYFPAGFLRTFQLGTALSPLSSTVRRGKTFISPEYLQANDTYREYLAKLIGEGPDTFRRLTKEGATLRSNRLYYGDTNDVALKYASAFTAAPATEKVGRRAYIGAGYARALGATDRRIPFEEFFSKVDKDMTKGMPMAGGFPIQIIGGQSRLQSNYRFAAGIGTELVERFNRLLRSPVENALLSPIFSKIGPVLGVQKTGGLRMLGKLGFKYGAGLSAAILGYQTLDWAVENTSMLNNTIFDEGLTVGAATMVARGHIATAQASEALGLKKYRDKQEEIAPGSTDLRRLLAYPIATSAGASVALWAYKAGAVAKEQWKTDLGALGPIMARDTIEKNFDSWKSSDLVESIGKAIGVKGGWYSRQDWLGKAVRSIARPNELGELIYKGIGKMTPMKGVGLLGAATGLAFIAPFIPGALIPDNTGKELKDIYSGKTEVGIRKGRWWEMGSSDYQGAQVMYFRPNWYARMRIGARDKSIWGDDADKLNPLQKWYKREFTYELEKKHYKDQPFPITSLPFEDIPLIGPILSNTIGRLIKPPKLMHEDEWRRGNKTLVPNKNFGERVATEMGQKPAGQPVSPYDLKQTFGEQVYRMTEMVGLPGFMATSIKEKLTGRQDFFDEVMQLESSRRMFGAEKGYWDLELGGIFGASESLRRLIPHRRRQIELYNPIRNTMPDWLPGSGEKGPDLLHGSPYSKIQEGELRLPGKGYEARFPELKGFSPEDYPLIHRYRILADVGPYTEKFEEMQGKIRALRATKSWTDYDEGIYQNVKGQSKLRKKKQTFYEYNHMSPTGLIGRSRTNASEESSETVRRINEINRNKEPGEGAFKKAISSYWEWASHSIETPLDQLTPLAPGSKLMHIRSATEGYERDVAYGTSAKFWNRPVENFIKPFVRTAGASLGYTDIPDELEKKRKLEEYFDVLTYVKNTRLANKARDAHDWSAVAQFEEKKDSTLFGINPFTRNYKHLMRALPARERDYFSSFEKADTVEDRKKILQMVPENEKALYLARWKLLTADKIRKGLKKGILNEEETLKAKQEVSNFYDEANTEGLPRNKQLMQEYVSTRLRGENYSDWYRRTKILSKMALPKADWVGFHPSVDLEDIKLKVVQTRAEDMHDYNLWESRSRDLPNKDYIDDNAIAPITQADNLTASEKRSRINDIFGSELAIAHTSINNKTSGKNEIDVTIEKDRHKEAEMKLKKMV